LAGWLATDIPNWIIAELMQSMVAEANNSNSFYFGLLNSDFYAYLQLNNMFILPVL
jgi:hypothetical protein